jgi:hypothetical protein
LVVLCASMSLLRLALTVGSAAARTANALSSAAGLPLLPVGIPLAMDFAAARASIAL